MPGSLVADCLCGTLHPTETYQQGTCQTNPPDATIFAIL